MTTTALQTFWPASGVGLHITGPSSTPLITVDGDDMPSTDLTPETAVQLAADLLHAAVIAGYRVPGGSDLTDCVIARAAQMTLAGQA